MAKKRNWGGPRKGAGRSRRGKRPCKQISCTISEEVVEELDALKEETGSSRSAIIQQAVMLMLESQKSGNELDLKALIRALLDKL